MITYPADEHRIWEVEQGRSCETVVRLPPGDTLTVGDSIIFALASARPGQEPCFVRGGDSVRVILTMVTLLDVTDPVTGQALAQLSWRPPGPDGALQDAGR